MSDLLVSTTDSTTGKTSVLFEEFVSTGFEWLLISVIIRVEEKSSKLSFAGFFALVISSAVNICLACVGVCVVALFKSSVFVAELGALNMTVSPIDVGECGSEAFLICSAGLFSPA